MVCSRIVWRTAKYAYIVSFSSNIRINHQNHPSTKNECISYSNNNDYDNRPTTKSTKSTNQPTIQKFTALSIYILTTTTTTTTILVRYDNNLFIQSSSILRKTILKICYYIDLRIFRRKTQNKIESTQKIINIIMNLLHTLPWLLNRLNNS